MSRQIIRVTGEDRLDFLQDLVTNDVTRAPCWAALLTPQGKYLADFLILSDGDALLLDVDAGLAEDLLRRLGDHGVDFTDLHSKESSLEEIFVRLIHESKRSEPEPADSTAPQGAR